MTTSIKIFGLLILFSLALISCDKDCDKAKDKCNIDNCSVCQEKTFEGKEAYIFDELGNKFTWDQFKKDSQGKFLTDDNGNPMYCNSDAKGHYYTNHAGTNIYFKNLDWANKDKEIEKYILSPLVTDNDCGYIVKGKIKYLVNGKTAAIVDYGDGKLDAWATKTIYYEKKDKYGKGKSKEYTKCCKFEQKCKKDLPVTKIEAHTAKKSSAGTAGH